MKCRCGLVSNSSSSSFICDTKYSVDEVKEKISALMRIMDMEENIDSICYVSKAGDKVEVVSVRDNSIPYIIQEFIEEFFHASRSFA